MTDNRANCSRRIWRYRPYKYFRTIFESEVLYFTRIDQFDDPLDGTYPREFLEAAFGKLPDNEYREAKSAVLQAHEVVWRERTYANCWHVNENESYAFWRIYTSGNDGVAVTSTCERLEKAFLEESPTFERVNYIDYSDLSSDAVSTFNRTWETLRHKHKPYAFENELRAIYRLSEEEAVEQPEAGLKRVGPGPHGKCLKVDLGVLIESIYVSPWISVELEERVRRIVDKSGLDREVRRSSIPVASGC